MPNRLAQCRSEHPLDSGFDILEGQRTVTVPNVDVSHGNKYQILGASTSLEKTPS